MDTPRRAAAFVTRDAVAALVLVMMSVATWAPRMAGPLDFRWDGGAYYVLGTSIAEGKGYRLLNEPGEIEATQYPPLLPLLVAAHQRLVGSNDFVVVGRWLRLTFSVVFVAYVLTAYAVLRRYLPIRYALPAAMVCVVNRHTNLLSDLCFAEIPFALATTVFVLAHGWETRRSWRLAAGACAVVTYLLRTTGVALLAAWVLEGLLKRKVKGAAVRAAIALVPVLGWHAYIIHVERSPAYTQPAYVYQRADYMFYNVSYSRHVSLREPFTPGSPRASLADIAWRMLRNAWRLPASLGEAVTTNEAPWGWIREIPIVGRIVPARALALAPAVVGLMVLAGVGILLVQGVWLIALYVIITWVAVCLTPWPEQWPRYWVPIVPFLALALARCLLTLEAWSEGLPDLAKGISRACLVAFGAGILIVGAATTAFAYSVHHRPVVHRDGTSHPIAYRLFFYTDSYRALDEGLDWLAARASSDAILAASMPHWAYLRTGLKAVMPPFEPDAARIQTALDSVPVSYVIVDGTNVDFTRTYTLSSLRSAPERWKLVYWDSKGKLEIYQRVRE